MSYLFITIMYLYTVCHLKFYSTSNNIQSQDGNSRITLHNLKRLEKMTLADILSLLKDFVTVI